MRRVVRFMSIVVALWTALAGFMATLAQNATPIGSPESIGMGQVGTLAEADIDTLPFLSGVVLLSRITIEPDGHMPSQTMVGPAIVFVESGRLTMMADQEIEVSSPLADVPEPGRWSSTRGITVEQGQTASIADGSISTIINKGAQPASLLMLRVFDPQMMGAERSFGEAEGVTIQPIASIMAAFAPGPVKMVLARTVIDPGETTNVDASSGAVLTQVEKGAIRATLDSGICSWSPAMQGEQDLFSPRMNLLVTGEAETLSDGQSLSCQSAMAALRAGDQGATVLQARVTTSIPATPIDLRPENAPVGVLGEVRVEALPVPDAEVWFLRFELMRAGTLPSEPAGFIPLGPQIGPTVFVVESGSMTIISDKPVDVQGGASATPVPAEGDTLKTVAGAGQLVYVREGTTVSIRNDGNEPVSVLALLTFSPQREMETMQATAASGEEPQQPVAFTQQPIGLGRATFPEGPGTITIERLAFEPGASQETVVGEGAVAGGVEQGGGQLTLVDGSCYFWPAMMTISNIGPVEMQPNKPYRLVAGDGFGCWGGAIRWQAGDDGASVLRVRIAPVDDATPAPTPTR